jgi:hypothetical protein
MKSLPGFKFLKNSMAKFPKVISGKTSWQKFSSLEEDIFPTLND